MNSAPRQLQRGKVSHRSTADNHTCVCGCVLETGTGPRPCPAALSVRPALDGHRRRATRRRAARRRKHERVESGGAGSAGVECATKGVQTGPLGPIIWAFSLATTMGCSHGPHRQSEECAVLSTRIGESLDTPKKKSFLPPWIMVLGLWVESAFPS